MKSVLMMVTATYTCAMYTSCTQRFGVGEECMSNGKSPGTAPLTLSYIIRNLL